MITLIGAILALLVGGIATVSGVMLAAAAFIFGSGGLFDGYRSNYPAMVLGVAIALLGLGSFAIGVRLL